MTPALQLAAIGIFIGCFVLAAWRGAHLGVVMFAAACGVGVLMAKMPIRDVLAGFPVGIMVLLVGVTYLFAIAHGNGTIDRAIDAALGRVGDNAALLPFLFFLLTAAICALGSALAGLVLAPVAMLLARRHDVDPMLMALAIGTGQSAGSFAPTSLFGIVTYGTAHQANIPLNPLTLFGIAVATNLVLLAAAYLMFGGPALVRRRRSINATPATPRPAAPAFSPSKVQVATLACLAGLVVTVIAASAAGLSPDVGVLCLVFAAILALIDPAVGATSVARIDWSTVWLVGGIVTYVGVLQHMGAVDFLGEGARHVGSPIAAALIICAVGGLVSAFASTTGVLAALVPLALPLVASGDVAGWAMISALGICSSIVDVSPFSTTGATVVAAADESARPRMTRLLIRWGMAMVVIGPIALVSVLVAPSTP
ncbi:MAG: C4-dicarboxylate ABC transporter [Cytophagaceae bacterium]|nr:C4-dicarboxylate ABC transporter [Gemmatimonadaceae bacterium]